jgi:uncharacterized membrane protein
MVLAMDYYYNSFNYNKNYYIILVFYLITTAKYMNSTVLDRPYQAERTDEQTPRVNVRGICQAVLFIFIVIFNCLELICVSVFAENK